MVCSSSGVSSRASQLMGRCSSGQRTNLPYWGPTAAASSCSRSRSLPTPRCRVHRCSSGHLSQHLACFSPAHHGLRQQAHGHGKRRRCFGDDRSSQASFRAAVMVGWRTIGKAIGTAHGEIQDIEGFFHSLVAGKTGPLVMAGFGADFGQLKVCQSLMQPVGGAVHPAERRAQRCQWHRGGMGGCR